MPNRAQQIFQSEFKFGLGGVPLGNEFAKRTDDEAQATLEAAWEMGVRYYDVAPWYGFGLSERRFGHFLHGQRRDDFVLSSKVGKLFKASKRQRVTRRSFRSPIRPTTSSSTTPPTACAARSRTACSGSACRIIDVAYVHDLSPDFAWFPNGWEEQYAIARKGAFPALSKMRDEGIIRAWGVGVNTPMAILKVIEDADPDVCLCARQYSLVDHANALHEVFPAVRAKNVSLVIGSSLNAGFIPGSPRYNYGKDNFRIPPDVLLKREQLRAVAAHHGVDLRTAALQFSAAAPEAVALVVGAGSARQVQENWNSMQAKIPAEFWAELKHEQLIDRQAHTPAA